MAKKINKETNEVSNNKTKLEVTNCDLKSIDDIHIESLIRVIRGQQVMLDSDLAMLYSVETKRLNEQVKRNIERFPEDFMFQLTKEETVSLRSQIATLNGLSRQYRNFSITTRKSYSESSTLSSTSKKLTKPSKLSLKKSRRSLLIPSLNKSSLQAVSGTHGPTSPTSFGTPNKESF